ncbi:MULTISPECIES: hypothetical protein [Paenibacillus]|jgi:hypothetical protein|uniref:Nitrile hydratase subunit beta n=1 Tax=Paenibacillus azoreducens TaxID=116718 RepID=A0A919YK91_9BACL|nr:MULTISPECIES: hypothetical protein [Paenibacillus]GIO50220.1 hypothetical protein J34TS1_49850 [Paenibacillus azoreducens]
MIERFPSGMDYVQMMAKLGDLKDEHYRNTLALSTIVELLIDKGILTREEVERKAAELDQFMVHSPYPMV